MQSPVEGELERSDAAVFPWQGWWALKLVLGQTSLSWVSGSLVQPLFAFEYKEEFPENGWQLYDPLTEYRRLVRASLSITVTITVAGSGLTGQEAASWCCCGAVGVPRRTSWISSSSCLPLAFSELRFRQCQGAFMMLT